MLSSRFFVFGLACLISLLLGGVPETSASAKDVSMPAPLNNAQFSDLTVTRLPNGLTVAVKKDSRFPLASLRLYVHAGSAYEIPEQAGISHQLEHMVFKGTTTRPKGTIATEIEKAGGYLNAATSFDYTVYLTDMPSEHWALGLDVLKDMAFHPSLDAEELESEKEVVLAELQRGEDSPFNRLFTRVQARVLKGTPYERPIIGFPETIRAYTPETIRAYIDRLYQPQSMLLLVVGDVEPAAVYDEAVKLFGNLPNAKEVIPPKTIPLESFPLTDPTFSVEKTPWNKVYFNVSFPSVPMSDARAPALDVLSHLLGGDTSSYLYKKYKYQNRLVDNISAANYSFERVGLFTISATLSPENVASFWSEFAEDLAKLSGMAFSTEAMDRAKLAITDALHRQKETVAGTASALGQFLFFGHGTDGEQVYLQQIALANNDVLQKAAAAVLFPERLTVTVLEPENMPEQKFPDTGKKNSKKNPVTADAAWLEKTLRAAWPATQKTPTGMQQEKKTHSLEIVDLGGGRTLVLQPDNSMPYAAVDMAFAGGDGLLPPKKQGLATLAAATLTRGIKGKDATALEEFKNNRASSLAASSGREIFHLSMDYPAEFAEDMWLLLYETLTGATLPEQEISRAKENQTAAIVSREDQPLGFAFRKLFPFLFGEHLYGYQSQGSRETVASFTRNDIMDFWRKQAQMPWVLSICGVFDREAIIAAAKKLPVPSHTTQKGTPPAWQSEKEMTLTMPGRNQAHLLLVFPGTAIDNADKPGLELLQSILSGQSGLLFRDLRDKQGLGYTVTTIPWQAPLTGAIILYIGTEPEKMDVAAKGFASVLKDLHENLLPEEELVRGKNQMRGDYVRSRQKMAARSAEAASLTILGRPLDANEKAVAAAQMLTAQDLQILARKYLVPENAYTVKVLPE